MRRGPAATGRRRRGDLGRTLAEQIITRSFADQTARQLAVLAKMRQVQADLEGPDPTPIERLLAERCAVAWLDLHVRDLLALQASESLDLADHMDRMRHRAHQRYTSALKALASVRRIGNLPAIQVNLTHQQVNLVSDPPARGSICPTRTEPRAS